MPLYLYVLLGSISIPLIYTLFVFDVIQKWRHFFISTSLVACVFLAWDAVFTAYSVWGFNMDYCVGYEFFGMPIEEWLFFITIPFVCVFTHLVLKQKLPNFKLQEDTSKAFSFVLIFISLTVFLTNIDKLYTSINALVFLITLLVGWGVRGLPLSCHCMLLLSLGATLVLVVALVLGATLVSGATLCHWVKA